jgi:hypothetical protein
MKENALRYYYKHHEKNLERGANYRRNNLEKVRARVRKYNAEHKKEHKLMRGKNG